MLDAEEIAFIELVEKCNECEMLNMHCGTYMWCDEYNKLCADVKNCTGKNGKVRLKWWP
jgi:hypothetical protein